MCAYYLVEEEETDNGENLKASEGVDHFLSELHKSYICGVNSPISCGGIW